MNTITMILDVEEASVIIDALNDAINDEKQMLADLMSSDNVKNRDSKIFYERNRIIIAEEALNKFESAKVRADND